MSTPQEPTATSEQVSHESAPDATLAGTVWIKWDVSGGSDRTEPQVPIDTGRPLAGSPNIQAVEIRGTRVTLRCWADTWENGQPAVEVEGPTNGKVPVNPKRRIGYYRVVTRP